MIGHNGDAICPRVDNILSQRQHLTMGRGRVAFIVRGVSNGAQQFEQRFFRPAAAAFLKQARPFVLYHRVSVVENRRADPSFAVHCRFTGDAEAENRRTFGLHGLGRSIFPGHGVSEQEGREQRKQGRNGHEGRQAEGATLEAIAE